MVVVVVVVYILFHCRITQPFYLQTTRYVQWSKFSTVHKNDFHCIVLLLILSASNLVQWRLWLLVVSVSYTHLTLPTNREV